jgi:pyruvate-ferredoxin/flavodoxin oxidoreductase
MWFNKSKELSKDYPLTGLKHFIDGHTAAAMMESAASEAVLLSSVADYTAIPAVLAQRVAATGFHSAATPPATIHQSAQPEALLNQAAGMAATGLRTGILTNSLAGIQESLSAVAGRRLPLVINLSCRAVPRQAASLHGGHDEYYAAAAAGFFQLFASNVQEVADLNLIAHRIAELSLTPGIVAQDCYTTSHGIQRVHLPGQECIDNFLGAAADQITAPTPAQALLFGEQRRRIPALVNIDHPAGIGGTQSQDSYFAATAAQRPFFYDHIDAIAAQAMQEYGELTGRCYAPVAAYRADDAELLVIAQGAVIEELRFLVDYLRRTRQLKIGLINLTMLRPFPGARLAQLLKGKQAVTILERTDQPMAEGLPLINEVRAALDKALENGTATGAELPYPAYPGYTRMSDRPRLYSGIYGVGTALPSANTLQAAINNMLDSVNGKRCFYLGQIFNSPDRRFPHLQAVQQKLQKNYPSLAGMSLPATTEALVAPDEHTRTIRIHASANQGGLLAVNIMAQALAYIANWSVRTFPGSGFGQDLQHTSVTLQYTRDHDAPGAEPDTCDTVLVTTSQLLADPSVSASIRANGTLIISTDADHQTLWDSFPNRIKIRIRQQQVRIYTINTGNLVTGSTTNPVADTDRISIWALLGAGLEKNAGLAASGANSLTGHISDRLQNLPGFNDAGIQKIIRALTGAADNLAAMTWQTLDDAQAPVLEPEAPWNIRHKAADESNVFNTTRFWHSVGYLYGTGQSDYVLTDPYLATGIMPACSSISHDLANSRKVIPSWQPEKCTGCGLCWTMCPESALPATLYGLSTIIDFAIRECETRGQTLTQIKRLQDPLAKQAYQIINRDGLHQFPAVGSLLDEAFTQLVKRMDIQGEQLDVFTSEFKQLGGRFDKFNTAKTDRFFDSPHQQEKGSGSLLAITLNPASCTACGICLAVCPEQAFTWAKQSTELAATTLQNWQTQMALPGTEEALLARHVIDADPATGMNRLLQKSAYHSMVGSDGSVPGNLAKTVAHIITATIDSVMQPRFKTHIDRLGELIKGLEQKIQDNISSTLNINDFDEFSRKLGHLDSSNITTEQLVKIINDDAETSPAYQAKLKRMGLLLHRLKQIQRLYTGSAANNGRARMLLVTDPAGAALWHGTYPYNPHANPWISMLPDDITGLAEGLFAGTSRLLIEELDICHSAARELSDAFSSEETAPVITRSVWQDLAPAEKQLFPPVLVLCRSETREQARLGRLLATGYPLCVVIIDSDGLSLAPGLSTCRLSDQPALDALVYPDAYILQSTAAHPEHIIRGVTEALGHQGPSLLHIYAPDNPNTAVTAGPTLARVKLAGDSRSFPLLQSKQDGTGTAGFSLDDNPQPQSDWVSAPLPVRNPAGQETIIERSLTAADWALHDSRFQDHFRILGRGHLNPQLVPLVDYLDLDLEQRAGVEPYINFADANQQHMIAVVSATMVAATAAVRENWQRLQLLSGRTSNQDALHSGPEVTVTPQPAAPVTGEAVPAVQQVVERLLALCGYSRDPEYFSQSLREFISREKDSV